MIQEDPQHVVWVVCDRCSKAFTIDNTSGVPAVPTNWLVISSGFIGHKSVTFHLCITCTELFNKFICGKGINHV